MSVQSLLSYALTVPDLAPGQRFYTAFGLVSEERDNSLTFRCEGRDQEQVNLVEGKRKQLNHLRFGTNSAGMKSIRARMAARQVAEIDAPNRTFGEGLWLRDPDGN